MAVEPLVCVDDFEKLAFKLLPKNALDYYRSGANHEQTLQDNTDAFKRLRIRPRMLVGVANRDPSTTILGQKIDFPICIAPTAMHRMAEPDGELATSRAAASMNTAMILSTLSTTSIEDVAAAAPSGLRWFQLYIYRDRAVTRNLVARAERSGYKALVLTVDTPLFGRRIADSKNRFVLPPHLKLANFDSTDFKGSGLGQSNKDSGLSEYANSLFDASLNWSDISYLRTISKLPIVVKGILTAEDALKAVEVGVDGIIVSNHGARQLDGVPATIDALPEVISAVNGRCEVYLDGGVRQGTDCLKALAIGARAVFVGRPVLWGLACDGEKGVGKVLSILKDELTIAMGLAGCRSVSDIKQSHVVKESYYWSKL
ncbi:2-Hydroxyacid oxidase 1-like [Lineus longissimus]|uniref:2-Hydroxyacid oxidase 1-like n=1 Tax=Lineus longissimus TaxID=88925 RepID=UPI002B4EDB4E